MAFCTNCGNDIGNSKFCKECGEKNIKQDVSIKATNEIEKEEKKAPVLESLEDLKKHLNKKDNSPILSEFKLDKIWLRKLENPLLKFRTLEDEEVVLTKEGIYMNESNSEKSYSFLQNLNNPLEIKYFDASKRFESKNGKYSFRFKKDVDEDSLMILLSFIKKLSETTKDNLDKLKKLRKTNSQQNLETGSKNKRIVPLIVIIISSVISFVVLSESGNNSDNKSFNTKDCLVSSGWVYPSTVSPSAAWKFSSNGTFSSSNLMFGGMSSWGRWKELGLGEIIITYTRTTEGYLPNDMVITLSSCNRLIVGNTTYYKD
mgnify:CR=1 FL=1